MKRFKRLSKWRNSSGFTLVEVIVSTALLGVLVVGILLFMTPVFSMATSREVNGKAERAVTTMETYLSKTLRSSVYVKAFTNAAIDDVNQGDGAIYNDAELAVMQEFVAKRKDNYELRCISIRYVEDTNPRNNTEGGTPYKYMLYSETFNASTRKIDTTKSQLIFDGCFYEDLYPTFTFERIQADFDADGNLIPNPLAEGAPEVKITLYPAIKLTFDIYGNEVMNEFDRVYRGVSFIELNNIKSLQLNDKGEYQIFETEQIRDGSTSKDTFVFYVARKTGTVVASPTPPDSETAEAA